HLSHPTRSLWHAQRATVCVSTAAGSFSRSSHDDGLSIRPEPSLQRRRVFPTAAVFGFSLGPQSREFTGSEPRHLLLPPMGVRPHTTPTIGCSAQKSLST